MSVTVEVEYEGDLHCAATHGPSGHVLRTDAPVDNRGKGEAYSPTDLVGTAMGTCMLTIMGIAALDRGLDLAGARVTVTKEMGAEPRRHIARLTLRFVLPARFSARERQVLERAAHTCPVAASMGPLTEVVTEFEYR